MPWLAALLTILAAYFVGAIPFGYLVARLRGVNIFEHGSGNIGATNVGRVLGRPLGIFVFALDFAKGAGPVALAMLLKPSFDDDLWQRGYVEVAAGLTAFLGHLFPVFFKFKGGKGVATALGILIAINVWLGIATFSTWLIVVFFFRYSSLAAIVASVFAPVYFFFLFGIKAALPAVVLMSALLVWRHRENITKLMAGTESRLGQKKPTVETISAEASKT